MKKPIKKRPRSPSALMISLLNEIKEELIIERESKLRNALILATAIVMFAVPLNFMVEVTANYIDSSSSGGLDFYPDNLLTPYYILFWVCFAFIIFAFWNFFRPMSRIFMDSFDWKVAFSDMEETGKEYDGYHIETDTTIFCKICDQEFESYRGWERHEDTCRSENKDQWKKWDEETEGE